MHPLYTRMIPGTGGYPALKLLCKTLSIYTETQYTTPPHAHTYKILLLPSLPSLSQLTSPPSLFFLLFFSFLLFLPFFFLFLSPPPFPLPASSSLLLLLPPTPLFFYCIRSRNSSWLRPSMLWQQLHSGLGIIGPTISPC